MTSSPLPDTAEAAAFLRDPGPSFWTGRDGSWGCEQCGATGQASGRLAAAFEAAIEHETEAHPSPALGET